MKPPVLLLASALVAIPISVATVKALESPPVDSAQPTEQIRERLTNLEAQVSELRRALSVKSEAAVPADTRVSSAEIELAVERVLSKRAAAPISAAEAAGGDAPSGAPASAGHDAASFFAKLRNPATTAQERRQVWAKAKEAGLLDALVDAFEEYAKENAGSANAQCDYGHALVEKLQTMTSGPDMGKVATAADRAFDRALEIDPRHWDARFSKAVGLSFWPPIFGKQNEAIFHFETLRKQQEESGGVKPEFAQTYQFLGNLYQQMGKADKAAETWSQGLKYFPSDPQLKQSVEGAAGK